MGREVCREVGCAVSAYETTKLFWFLLANAIFITGLVTWAVTALWHSERILRLEAEVVSLRNSLDLYKTTTRGAP